MFSRTPFAQRFLFISILILRPFVLLCLSIACFRIFLIFLSEYFYCLSFTYFEYSVVSIFTIWIYIQFYLIMTAGLSKRRILPEIFIIKYTK